MWKPCKYSPLSNKRGGGAKFAKSLNVEVGINVEGGIFGKKLVNKSNTGWFICIRTVGVASKPVEPNPLSFAGFFIYVKWKFIANLKQIGALMWK